MRRIIARLFGFSAVLMLLGLAMTQRVSAQDCVIPTSCYRFFVSRIPPGDGGFLLTAYYPEGPANNYELDHILIAPSGPLGIYYHPNNGNVPDPDSGLVPLYRWTVIQDGWRTHYYYSTYYTEQPPDRYFNGIAGYVFPPWQTTYNHFGVSLPLTPLRIWYSSDYGFWYGHGAGANPFFYESPPPVPFDKDPFHDQGIIAQLPQSIFDYWFPSFPGGPDFSSPWRVCFQAPGGGGGGGGNPPDCNPPSSSLNACQHNGGWWNYEGCYCEY
jgi:hypothetical protein